MIRAEVRVGPRYRKYKAQSIAAVASDIDAVVGPVTVTPAVEPRIWGVTMRCHCMGRPIVILPDYGWIIANINRNCTRHERFIERINYGALHNSNFSIVWGCRWRQSHYLGRFSCRWVTMNCQIISQQCRNKYQDNNNDEKFSRDVLSFLSCRCQFYSLFFPCAEPASATCLPSLLKTNKASMAFVTWMLFFHLTLFSGRLIVGRRRWIAVAAVAEAMHQNHQSKESNKQKWLIVEEPKSCNNSDAQNRRD